MTEKVICPKCRGAQMVPAAILPVYFRCSVCEGTGETDYETAREWQQKRWREQRA